MEHYEAQDLARDLEGEHEVKVLDLATVEAK